MIAVYDATIQLVGAEGQLWAITTRENAGAYRIVTHALPRGTVDTIVEFSDNVLNAQGERIAWDKSALWNPRVMRRELTNEEKSAAANHIAEFLSNHEFPAARGFWNFIAEVWQSFALAIEKRDSRAMNAILAQIIGQGPGLTPTGDDFVQALLVTLASGDARDRQAFAFVSNIMESFLSRTTPLSRAFLREAMRGFAFGMLKELLEALPAVSTTHLTRLIDIGATSGFAYALGALFALDYQLPITDN